MNWTKEKPQFNFNCILLTATMWMGEWEYELYTIVFSEGYWKWCNGIGEEVGDIEDLNAEMYIIIPML